MNKLKELFENNCLFYFESIEQFQEIVENYGIDSWMIYAMPLSERTDRISYSDRYQYLDKQNDKTGTTNNKQEIVSWIDTMNFMYLMADNIEDKDGIIIIQELKIPYSNKRPDYILIKNNKILVIEFSFKKLGDEYQYENKLTQAIGYKELLSNILPNHIQIATYTYLIKPEAQDYFSDIYVDSKYTDKKVDPNYDGRIEMAKYIDNYFTNTKKDALHELAAIL